MMTLKACPRCEGDMHETSDIYGAYKQCIQCGHVVDLPSPVVAQKVKVSQETQQAA